jgi:hypothetical protein
MWTEGSGTFDSTSQLLNKITFSAYSQLKKRMQKSLICEQAHDEEKIAGERRMKDLSIN